MCSYAIKICYASMYSCSLLTVAIPFIRAIILYGNYGRLKQRIFNPALPNVVADI